MKNQRPFLLPTLLALVTFLILTGTIVAQTNGNGAAKPTAPMAEKKPKTTKIHGVTLVDDYFWLREKSNPQVMEYLRSEDSYTEAVMKPTESQQDKLLAAATDNEKMTEVRCFLGLDSIQKQAKDSALAHFRWVSEHGNPRSVEYGIALAELRRLTSK